MADLRGQQLKDSYQDVVTRGTGNKLENGNGVEFADLDNKASLSRLVLPLTESDATTLTWHEGDQITVGGGSYINIFDLSGAHEIISGIALSQVVGLRLTIDGTVVFNRTANIRGGQSGDETYGAVDVPNAISETSLKLDAYNNAGDDRLVGWRVATREV